MPLSGRILAVAGGYSHAFAVGADGTRWGWGYNSSGSLGIGDTSWVQTVNALQWARILESAPATLQPGGGGVHSVLLRDDGSLVAMGDNAYGQLGNGTTTDSLVPIPVPGLSLADNAWLASDADNDGLTAWREWLAGTDPYVFDTNGNGTPDGLEELLGPTGANPDTDLDGLANWVELQLGSDPLAADSDGDAVPDAIDAFPLDPTRSALPPPTPGDTTPPVITLTEPTTARPVGGGGGG
jgi:hypothetical protein